MAYKWLTRMGFLLYLVLVLKVVLFKHSSVRIISESMTIERLQFRLWHATNLTPFKTISYYLSGDPSYRVAIWNVAGNIAVLAPMGFLLPIVFPKVQRLRQVLGNSFMVSLSLEMVQLIAGLGSFDIDDILLNVFGATLGWLIYKGIASARA